VLLAAGTGLAVAGDRALEVIVELTGRVAAPADTGPAGARAPEPGCAAVVDAPFSLAARSVAALANSPTRDPESATALSLAVAGAREAEPAAKVDGALDAPDALGVAPPMPGIPNPAGDVGFAVSAGVLPAAGADEETELGGDACGAFADGTAGADVDACDVALEEVGAGAPLPAESVSTGPSGSNN
jgi:hypothetical protein